MALTREVPIIQNGKIQSADLKEKQSEVFISVLDYMAKTDNWQRFAESLELTDPPKDRTAFLKIFKFDENYKPDLRSKYITGRNDSDALDVSSYNTVIVVNFNTLSNTPMTKSYKAKDSQISVTVDPNKHSMTIVSARKRESIQIHPETKDPVFDSSEGNVRLIISNIGIYKDESGKSVQMYSLHGHLLIKGPYIIDR